MPQSLSCVYLHAIFSTKQRQTFLADGGLRREVHAYIAEVTRRLDCPAVEVGGFEDHVHMLARLGRTVTIADWMRETKRVSSVFVKERMPGFSWQSGYGVFGVDSADVRSVAAYIQNQEEHHRKVSFQDEFRRLLAEHSVEWDERYVWD